MAMTKFKIVFLDNKEVKVTALNFTAACVQARHARIVDGFESYKALLIDAKQCGIIGRNKKNKTDRKDDVINTG